MEQYAIVEFFDGLQMIPFSWMTEDKKYAYWPTFTSNDKFRKAVQKCISKMDDWPLHEIKRILATANTYEKGIKKLKKAEFISDVNSESEDNDTLKKSRKYRAKTVVSSEESFSEEENLVPVPSYPKVPQNTNLNKQLFENPAIKMPFKNKHVSKQIDYEDDNRSTKINFFKKSSETLCTSKNKNTDKNIVKQIQYENNSTLTSQNIIKKINPDKCCIELYKNNTVGHNFTQTNVKEKNALSFETFKPDSINTSSTDFQQYIVRKLLDMDFKISIIHEEQKNMNTKLDTIQNQIQTFVIDDRVEKKVVESDYMELFPLKDLEELEKLEQLLSDNKINRKALITQVARIGGTNVRSITFNILRRLLSDSVGSLFSYIGGKKKRSFFDLYLRKIIFSAVRMYFPEATEQNISEPIKSWLRHASERSIKKKNMDKTADITSAQENDQAEEMIYQTLNE